MSALGPNAEKAVLEAAIVRRREAEDGRVEYWSRAKTYYDRMERSNGKFLAWTSDEGKKQRWGFKLAKPKPV